MHTKQKGDRGEQAALELLLKKGFKLIDKNHRSDFGELDLVMEDGEEIVFVEVKSILFDSEVNVMEMVSEIKLSRLEMTISDWLLKHDMLMQPWRFDFVGIIFESNGEVRETEHLPHVEL